MWNRGGKESGKILGDGREAEEKGFALRGQEWLEGWVIKMPGGASRGKSRSTDLAETHQVPLNLTQLGRKGCK